MPLAALWPGMSVAGSLKDQAHCLLQGRTSVWDKGGLGLCRAPCWTIYLPHWLKRGTLAHRTMQPLTLTVDGASICRSIPASGNFEGR